jgi:hypothetical protein
MLRSALLTPGATRVMRAPACFASHLLLECRAYEARIMCTASAWDVRGMLLRRQHVTHAWDAHF